MADNKKDQPKKEMTQAEFTFRKLERVTQALLDAKDDEISFLRDLVSTMIEGNEDVKDSQTDLT